ncbi:hypothetical protein BZA70DRAFT_278670 [Myxozyma melibiosi]|uniref:Secreted protein n=1 Tax=Myxozyma melibiosi TaxID=54550 RepID=A0ABR1F4X5_9ASCO
MCVAFLAQSFSSSTLTLTLPTSTTLPKRACDLFNFLLRLLHGTQQCPLSTIPYRYICASLTPSTFVTCYLPVHSRV